MCKSADFKLNFNLVSRNSQSLSMYSDDRTLYQDNIGIVSIKMITFFPIFSLQGNQKSQEIAQHLYRGM